MLRALRPFRTPLLDLVAPAPYVGFQSALDSTVLHGWNYYWKSTHLPELTDDLIDVITDHAFSARRRGRTRRCSTWGRRGPSAARRHGVRRSRRGPQSPSMACGSLTSPASTPRPRPPGRGGSSPPSAASAKASTSTSSTPTKTPAGSARRTAIRLPAAGGGQGQVRPRQRLPPQQEHPPRVSRTRDHRRGGRWTRTPGTRATTTTA